jgi:purine nucleoside permease
MMSKLYKSIFCFYGGKMKQIMRSMGDAKSEPVIAAFADNPSFHADTGHWYLSKGIVGINNVRLIQKTLPNEQNQEEQREF